jgi:hypothetical protein
VTHRPYPNAVAAPNKAAAPSTVNAAPLDESAPVTRAELFAFVRVLNVEIETIRAELALLRQALEKGPRR